MVITISTMPSDLQVNQAPLSWVEEGGGVSHWDPAAAAGETYDLA